MNYEGIVNRLMEKKPEQSKGERIRDLYGQLYPEIMKDFSHTEDIEEALRAVLDEVRALRDYVSLMASLGSGLFNIDPFTSGPDPELEAEKGLALLVRKGEADLNGVVAKETRRAGTSPNTSSDADLLDPENPLSS